MISYWDELTQSAKKVLLLQGPIGPFFSGLADTLTSQHDCEVFKVNFNGGDALFYPQKDHTFTFSQSPSVFSQYLDHIIVSHGIDTVICFGHQRIYHQIAKQYCQKHQDKLTFWAFEEGYLRPHYVTLEKWGVNDHSVLVRDAKSYRTIYQELGEPKPPEPITTGFRSLAKIAMAYYTAMFFKRKQFVDYEHHREKNTLVYCGAWIRSGWRKIAYKRREKQFAARVKNGELGRFFIVPLQVHNDSQVKVHSDIKSVAAFLRKVLYSFAKDAPKNTQLVIKHHPMDRGFSHYGGLINRFIRHYHLENRVHYVFDVPLPILMRKGQGMVVINSTSGLSAMIHHLPVKVLGLAHYDFEGLTDPQSLNTFWQNPQAPNAALFNAYRLYHLHKTQINGSFYQRVILPNALKHPEKTDNQYKKGLSHGFNLPSHGGHRNQHR